MGKNKEKRMYVHLFDIVESRVTSFHHVIKPYKTTHLTWLSYIKIN